MTKQKTLDDLFHDTLRDIYYAERKILKTLPKLARAAKTDELRNALDEHRSQTEEQIERLQQVFEIIGKPARGKTCEAIEGMISEGDEIVDEFKDSPALDAGLIAASQSVEHYEIARYGALSAWAKQLGHANAVKLLERTLDEEKKTDAKLSKLAEKMNQRSAA